MASVAASNFPSQFHLMAALHQPSAVPDGLVYDVMTAAGDVIFTGDIVTIARTFEIQDLGHVQEALGKMGACEAAGNLWDKRDRKAGYPREDPITLIIRRQVTRTDEIGTLPKSLLSWY